MAFPEIIEEVQEVRACIAADGTIGVLTWRTAKIRCADCGAVELANEPPMHYVVKEFEAHPDGLAVIGRRIGPAAAKLSAVSSTLDVGRSGVSP